ncbi:Glutamate N-acetyltransferase [Prochlorococcus sp. SS52]|uniref:Arginine biosynthesis bifunctional protein ArgJ n=1 Tax=Prochlorococcus marinus (strain SARG / CCMP1375 / SS120) TaxID=167539 RepID=ARGJ_PROMA|nr:MULTISPECIES: bifunctional glutamate N-acetyltransferase/amino-acid acetyltransferase ArgJ [Prochlorococcus]Q7VEF9.1 RecName: Full=Arginine biosynthesis bifunctional protein ArgJ; Includes: RecName: Full=Glutamate N-acetyltransferase; AltName: Full=Ornithine acetyltransferase; Short=OATase; AltName: Full=Ornithine transacetylase; Includes: RecName: Full=Amino-acid acetyltransferase; AltName: Full=N-acetylglutamate synthase; Short=AGSase; Contains: RecName: Full=Arginine biosynthesis bifunctiona
MSFFQSSKWSLIAGGITAPSGFKASGVSAGLKPSKKLDLALLVTSPNAQCSGTFTQSFVRAKCINLCLERLSKTAGKVRAVLVNSGHANACTGNRGIDDSLIATRALAEKLDLLEEEVLICSTGVIGEPIPMQKLLKGLDPLVMNLSKEGGSDAAKAILTTDLIEKEIAIEGYLGDRLIRIGGMAKGSGMIHPNMATMLGFLTCDAGLPKDVWDAMIDRVVDCSFNAISVDGDTSTNDSFLAFAQGDILDSQHFNELEIGLKLVSTYLAQSIVRDGEGANCLFEVKVKGTSKIAHAQIIARQICSSCLVKTAIHGCDPNWGRILSAAGSTGIPFSLDEVSIWIGSFQVMSNGQPVEFNRKLVIRYMKEIIKGNNASDEKLIISLVVGRSEIEAIAWGCDLSSEYIHINADYTT